MTLHAAAPSVLLVSPHMQQPDCPECGNRLLAPEASEFLADGRIRHSWICEACGASFRTAVKLGKSDNIRTM